MMWLLIGGALLLRLVWLNADPALNLTWSGAPFTDEGLYSHAARNMALFGVWRTDGWDDRLVSPLWSLLSYATFALFGVGFVQLRLLNVALTTIALLLFGRFVRAALGVRAALLGMALLGFDYFWFQYSRLGLLEPGMVAWLVAAAWCFGHATDHDQHDHQWSVARTSWAIAGGVCAGIAVVWKSLALLFVPAPLIALLIAPVAARKRIAVGYLLGLALVLLLYVIIWYVPHRAELVAYNQFYATDRVPESVVDAGRVLWNNVRSREVWAQTPIIVIAAMLGAARGFRAAWRRSLPPGMALCLAWTICGLLLLIMPYSPSRYYTLLLPALVGLAVYAVASTDNHYWYKTMSIALLAAGLLWNGVWYAQWAAARRTTLIDGSRVIAEFVQPGQMVLGVYACGLSLENRLPCAPPFVGLANDDQPVERLGAQYAITEAGSPDDYLRRFDAPLLRRSQMLHEFGVGPRTLRLYRLQPENN